MANMIDLDSKRKLSYYSDFDTRSLYLLEPMESAFGPVPINPVNIEDSLNNENWPRFDIISKVNFTVNSPFVQRILSSVDVKPTSVIKLFCDHPNLTWDYVNNIPSRPLTSITKGPQYAVTRQIVKFHPSRYELQLLFIPILFSWSDSYQLHGIITKRTVVHLRSYGNRRRCFFRFIKRRN